MELERLQALKHNLMCTIESQMCNVYEADAEELKCAIDMLKDIEEAMYYCTITDAMQEKDKKEFEYKNQRQENNNDSNHSFSYYTPMMTYANEGGNNNRSYYTPSTYAASGGGSGSSSNNSGGGRSYYTPPIHYNDGGRMYYPGGDEYNSRIHGENGDRVAQSRRMYMEAKSNQGDKATQMRELEKYMQELSQDIVDMIQDASPEERQYLEKKMNTLASKIGQMK